MIKVIQSKLSKLILTIISMSSICVMFFWKKYQDVSKANKTLEVNAKQQGKVIHAQKKVINEIKNARPVDFDGNIKRMRKGKL